MKSIPSIATASLIFIAAQAGAQTHGGVHCDHFSTTGDTVCYNRTSGRVVGTSQGYSGQPGYKNNPATAAVPNKGTIPSGNYTINGSAQSLNGRPHANSIQLTPQAGTQTYGRTDFRIHGGNASGTASNGCIVANPALRQSVVNSGSTGTVAVRPVYPQSYNYNRVQMPQTYVPAQRPAQQSYNHSSSYRYSNSGGH